MRRLAIFLFALVTAWPAVSQDSYPSRPITLVVSYAAGGGSDFLGRVLAEGLRTRLHETVVVQNGAGAGSVVGSMQVARAKSDGYTLLINHLGLSTVPTLYKKFNFDPLAAFETIGLFAEAPMMIMARKEFAPRDFKELVAYAKANRDKLTMASAGMGSGTHLCAMLFQKEIGVPLTILQYKGAAPAVLDVRSGQVDLICDLPTTTSSQIRSGDLRAYVLAAPRRLATLPDVPTASEVGMPGLDISLWFGLYAPKGTPQPIVETLSKALRATVEDPAVGAQLEKIETILQPFDQTTPAAPPPKLASHTAFSRPTTQHAAPQSK